MNETPHPILELLARDQRYKLEAYQFVRDGLAAVHPMVGVEVLKDD